ncbi:type II secretion system major pseudopilin GspG [Duganella sp. FT109W]|uniref:Type II secretion system core protein G n=1 Tax=Duganella margarita TaxID=2692170 RepID=A0ABW9WH63_9BURK|nr:type II secretion system major pseudopilin GspG [Duganella margarita]MYN40404.1 type II secretion system major pseudopilin GspG [Duganella margarita]
MPANEQSGFTLLELLVVIVIIGLLAAFVGPKYFGQLEQSKAQITRAQIDALDKGLIQYRIDTGHYPSMEQGLIALFVAPANEALWRGPYLNKALPQDGWGNPYVYKLPGEGGRDFEVISYGSDGQPQGAGTAADIANWH